MKRNPNSNRSKKWIERNCLSSEKCASYVKEICDAYGVKCKISNEKLFVEFNDSFYRVYPDYDDVCIVSVNRKTGEKKWYEGDSCWIDFVLDVIG